MTRVDTLDGPEHRESTGSSAGKFHKTALAGRLVSFLLLVALLPNGAFCQSYWGTPVRLDTANRSISETATQPRLIYAHPGTATGILSWTGTGNSWLWDGARWIDRGPSSSVSSTGQIIVGLVPRATSMQYSANLRPAPCILTTCRAHGASCGMVPDGCGGSLNCGFCPAGLTCGGGGTPNVCSGAAIPGCVSSGSWLPMTVDSAGETGRYPSVAAEPSGVVHIAYYDVTNRQLKHAHRPAAGAWQIDVIEQLPIGQTFEDPALALDGAGTLHLIYAKVFANNNSDLLFRQRRSGGGWSAPVVVTSGGRAGRDGSLAVGPSGSLHASSHRYLSGSNNDIEYQQRSPVGVWQRAELVSRGYGRSSIDVDANGVVRVALINSTGELAFRKRLANGVWDPPEIVASNFQPSAPSLAVDGPGVVHVAFTVSGGSLQYGRRALGAPPTGGQWTLRTLDGRGGGASLRLDAAHRVHVAYADSRNQDIRYERQNALGVWQAAEIVDSMGPLGRYGVALDFSGSVAHVAYFDDSNLDLKYALRCP